jgi:hypothetical protein
MLRKQKIKHKKIATHCDVKDGTNTVEGVLESHAGLNVEVPCHYFVGALYLHDKKFRDRPRHPDRRMSRNVGIY